MSPEDRERYERVLAYIPDACNLGELLGHLRLNGAYAGTRVSARIPTMPTRQSIDSASVAETELRSTREALVKARVENERLRGEKAGLIAGVEKARKEGDAWSVLAGRLDDDCKRLQHRIQQIEATPPALAECEVCAAIKRLLIGGRETGNASVVPSLRGRANGIGKVLVSTLARSHEPLSVQGLARVLGLDERTVGQNLQYQVRIGRIARVGSGQGVKYVIALEGSQ